MQDPKIDTAPLWRNWMYLVTFVVVASICGLIVLLLGDHIHTFTAKPKYSKEQLASMAKERSLRLRDERLDDWSLVENGVHVKTGLKSDDNMDLVVAACTSCHSAKLITQNGMKRSDWGDLISWMRETQGMPDLGANEPKILDYLAQNYPSAAYARRAPLNVSDMEWYILNLEEVK